MPTFGQLGLGSKKTASQDYGFLVDQLDIKKSQLESDGKLSPGDYQSLTEFAQKIYSHPGLSPAQRSNIEVKIASYKSASKVSQSKESNDIARTNREVEDDFRSSNSLYANNPTAFLQRNQATLRFKLDRLDQSIADLQQAGDDATNHINEFNSTLNDFNDISQALDDAKNYSINPSAKPTSNFVAYLTTNSKGEIVNVEIGRTGSKTGFAETNGLYGGFQVYGKINRKDGGKNIFQLGSTQFSGSDLQIQDPTIPGSFRNAPLLSSDTKQGRNRGVVVESYKDVDLNTVRPQTGIRIGGWAEGDKGFLYHREEDGSYTKYVNADRNQLGISDNDIIKIPSGFEQNILGSVKQTNDSSQPPIMPVAPTVTSSTAPVSTPLPAASTTAPQTGGTSRNPSPTVRAPFKAGGIAAQALEKGKGILNYLFGK